MEITRFDAIQTFYVDAEAVNKTSEVFLTSIELYFKKKPTSSSIANPGVTLSICEVENDLPVLKKVFASSVTRLESTNIYAFGDASVSSRFIFDNPLQLKTNRFYGIVIQYDAPGFELWANKQGDKIVGTNTPSPGINSTKDGKFFNGAFAPKILQPLSNIDLKYKINIAKFTANSIAVELVNKDYEFLTINSISGTFVGGEYVFKRGANATGNVAISIGNTTITGTNTNFDELKSGSKFVVLGPEPTTNGTVLTVSAVISNTSLITTTTPMFSNSSTKYINSVIGKVYDYDPINKKLILYNSTANTLNYLSANDVLVGSYSKSTAVIETVDNFTVDRIVPLINITSPSFGTYTGTYNFSYSNGSAFIVDSTKERNIAVNSLNDVSKYDAYVLSRSNEVLSSYLYDTNAKKSAIVKLNFTVNSNTDILYTSPALDEDNIDFLIQQSNITSSSTVTIGGIDYDTEVNKNGTATSKYISKKVTFANNRFAEDIKVFANIYRPLNTDVKVYCKVHNSVDPDTYDDKQWTPLTITENSSRYSSSENKNDFIDYEFSLPAYPETANVVPGTFEVGPGNTIVIGTGVTVNSYITSGDVVRVYNPLESEYDYFVTGVTASNTSTFTINVPTSNVSVLGTGFKVDKVKYKNIAYTDPQNDQVCTQFNSSLSKIDRFDSMQIKIVFLANNTYYIPRVNSISVIGVSA